VPVLYGVAIWITMFRNCSMMFFIKAQVATQEGVGGERKIISPLSSKVLGYFFGVKIEAFTPKKHHLPTS
jgi:hypothetical protein